MNAMAVAQPKPGEPATGSPLLDRLWHAARQRGDAQPTADGLVDWARRYILFHNKRHPSQLGLREATHFLEHVAKTASEPLPMLAQARSALALLYGELLGIDLGELPWPRPPRVLDQLRLVLRVRHYSRATEECYVQWARRFILFHHIRHPRTMGAAEVEQFLGHLATEGRVSASTQNQAFNALLFFYSQVLEIDLGRLDAVRARRGSHRTTPYLSGVGPARCGPGKAGGGDCQADPLSHLSPQLRHAPGRTRRGHSHGAAAVGTREPGNDHDLHARGTPGGDWCCQPAGFARRAIGGRYRRSGRGDPATRHRGRVVMRGAGFPEAGSGDPRRARGRPQSPPPRRKSASYFVPLP